MTKSSFISHGKAMAFDISDRHEFALRRQDKDGIISLVCDDIDGFFVAVKSEDEIRPAIERGLKKVMGSRGYKNVTVSTDGSLAGPLITSFSQPS